MSYSGNVTSDDTSSGATLAAPAAQFDDFTFVFRVDIVLLSIFGRTFWHLKKDFFPWVYKNYHVKGNWGGPNGFK